MTSLNTRKQKLRKKSARVLEAEAEHERFLARMGVKGNSKEYRYDIPDYSTGPRMTSDRVAGNGNKKEAMKYTGTLIKGVATMHKSNLQPITSKQQAIDSANMRRQ
jgi:tRNA U38,U39,U40 pseudouridine synthase TruA